MVGIGARTWLGIVVGVVLLLAHATSGWAEIVYSGSSTIGEHIMPEASKAFAAGTGTVVRVADISGSGKGFDNVLKGQADLAGVSRALTSAERGQRIFYRIIGYDAVTVIVHQDNPITSLSRDQVKAIFTGRITNWREVGGRDEKIIVVTQIPGAGRAQMIEFQQHALDGLPYLADRRMVDRQSDQVSAVLAEPRGIASLSPAFARAGIRAVAINGFSPEPAHIRSGAYLLSRPLVLVSQVPPKPDVRRFIEFLVSPEGQAIVAKKFVTVK